MCEYIVCEFMLEGSRIRRSLCVDILYAMILEANEDLFLEGVWAIVPCHGIQGLNSTLDNCKPQASQTHLGLNRYKGGK